jgi:hypothetical protein
MILSTCMFMCMYMYILKPHPHTWSGDADIADGMTIYGELKRQRANLGEIDTKMYVKWGLNQDLYNYVYTDSNVGKGFIASLPTCWGNTD